MDEDLIRQIARQEVQAGNVQSTYGVSLVPSHIHSGVDSPILSYTYILSHVLYGATAATAANYSVFFTAPTTMTIASVTEIHTTAGSDVGNVTLNIEKLTGTTAPAGGSSILSTAFNLKGTANTLQTGLLAVAADNKRLSKGDRLALVLAGTPTALANVQVTITLTTLLV